MVVEAEVEPRKLTDRVGPFLRTGEAEHRRVHQLPSIG
jgi:hypothetical protein